uniref:LuxR-family transcriptional regulator n=1 Tax=Streptomyces olivoviridis TaxID=67338 RepID=T2HVP8_9ACTN|nr:putative LuxR family transcriptional regulator [Streptomyces olivoviridis]BBI93414.1 LuxR-family transcriptional regulator [Streptomyces olivoviridis]
MPDTRVTVTHVAELTENALRGLLARGLADGDGTGPVLLLIEGAAGTGKTRLLNRLLSGLPVPARTSAAAVLAAADPGGRGPGSDPDSGSGPGLGPDAGSGLGPGFGSGHGLGLGSGPAPGPGLGSGPAPTPGPAPGPSTTGAGSRPAPLLLAVEDVHRAGADEMAALRVLLAAPPARFACVLTHRPEELAEPGLVLGARTEFPAGLTVVRQTLGPLDRAAVGRFAAAVPGAGHCTADLVTALHHASGGNAQTVSDLLDLLAAHTAGRREAQPGPGDLERIGVPPRLAALALRRTAAVPEAHRPVVFAAAVLDRPATARELAAVAGLSESLGRAALLAALRGAALCEHGVGRYGFAAPLAAAAVRRELPGPVREALHGRAAALLARQQPVPWERLAAHRRACGDQRGWLRAVERAAQEFADTGEIQRAVRLLEDALSGGEVPAHARSRLATLLARSAVMGLRSDQTLEVLQNIVAGADLPPTVRGEIRLDLGLLLCNQMGRILEGQAELVRAVDDLAGQPVPLARAMSALSMPYWPGMPLADNIAWLERAVTVAAESGDPVVQAAVAANQVSVLLNIGDPAAWPLIDALPRHSELLGARQQASRGLCNAADAAAWLGHYRQCRALLDEGVALAARNGAAYAEQTGRGAILVLDWATGRWAGLAARARALVDEVGDMASGADARMVLGLLALARGEWADTTEHLTGPDSLDRDSGPVPLSATASGALIRLALARDETGPAAAEADAAWQRLRAKGGTWAWGADLAPWAVEATVRAGNVSGAREMTAEFAAGLEDRDAPSADAALEWTRGVLAEHTGDPAVAVRHYAAAAEAYAAMPRLYHAALTAAAAARCALALGIDPGLDGPLHTLHPLHPGPDGGPGFGPGRRADTGPAVAALADCADRFEALGATWDAARTRADLRAHSPAEERRAPGRPSYGDLLSPREAEVAELAGAGMTNREIAAALHLSPRTVEQHVARALRKTGAHSRQQLSSAHRAAAPAEPTAE